LSLNYKLFLKIQYKYKKGEIISLKKVFLGKLFISSDYIVLAYTV
jgi:hypothetical protein